MLSQFTQEHPDHQVLGDLFNFPKDVYAVGRLDRDSEGLLILTNDKSINAKLLHPKRKHDRTYWVQVEGELTNEAIQQLAAGVRIRVKSKTYETKPCRVQKITPPNIWQRTPPVRFRKTVPTSWASISLTEGKNRQVRKMFASVGFPVLRLIRYAIEELTLKDLENGSVLELSKEDCYNLLNL